MFQLEKLDDPNSGRRRYHASNREIVEAGRVVATTMCPALRQIATRCFSLR